MAGAPNDSVPGKKSQFCLGELLLSEMKSKYPNAEGLGLVSQVREDSVAFILSFGLLGDSDARLSTVQILVELGTSGGSAQLRVAKAFYASGSPQPWADCSGERVDGSLLKNCAAIIVGSTSNSTYRTIVGLLDVPASREMSARRMLSVQREIMSK